MSNGPASARPDPADRDGSGGDQQSFGDLINGLSLDSDRPRRWRRGSGRTEPVAEPTGADFSEPDGSASARWTGWPSGDEPDEDDDATAPAVVRAYAWTGGRTRPQYRLEIETMLSTTERYRPADETISAEHHAVAVLCQQPRSVAEIAALLALPLGIAKVLLGDLAAQGLLAVHEVAGSDGNAPDLMLMERILSGLRRL